MASSELLRVFSALERGGVRYLVVGGVAVVMHGHLRMTADLDLVVALDADNVRRAATALGSLGYRPRAPVQLEQLADPVQRAEWVTTENLTVLSLWSPNAPGTEIDVFVQEPFEFTPVHARALRVELEGTDVTVVAIQDLIAMKKAAGRTNDLQDVDALTLIAAEDDDG